MAATNRAYRSRADAPISIGFNKKELARAQAMLGPQAVTRAMPRAVNKVAVKARAEIVSTIRRDVPIKASALKADFIRLRKATRKSPSATITLAGGRPGLEQFPHRQTAKGVKYKVSKSRGWQLIPHGFIPPPSASKGAGQVMQRFVEGGQFVPRLPIVHRKGPSLASLFRDLPGFARGVYERTLRERLGLELARQVEVELKRQRDRATPGGNA